MRKLTKYQKALAAVITEHVETSQPFVFNTPFEEGCVATSSPDPWSGQFDALDSDGVECSFSLQMVQR